MDRRKFLTTAGVGAGAAALATPHVARAQAIEWKMTTAFPPGQPFYSTGPGSLTDFTDRVRAMSNGALDIQVYHAGELVPAFEGFDAVRQGIVEMNGWVSYFGAGKVPAAQFFGAVPFGMSTQGQNAWFYIGDGIDLWNETYEPLGIVAMPVGATGVQMTGWFNKEINSIEDMQGLKMRIPGLAGRAYARVGVDVQLLPGGEIFPALERGVIDAAEFVGPYQDRRLGLQNAAKFYHTTGWHEPATTGELIISKAAWDSLPADLQLIVRTACMAACLESVTWSEANNGEALTDLIENFGVTAAVLPEPVVDALRTATADVLSERAAADPLTQEVHDSYMAFKANHDRWAGISESPWLRDIIRV
jgi:TRAP-type mannitol/chloroaromatic compound transport system substrate-binding protein